MSAWHSPMPAQAPLMAAMTGFGIVVVCHWWRRGAAVAAGAVARAVAADALEHVHVRAGAEAPAGAGDDDRPHVGIGRRPRRAGRSSGVSSSPVQALRRSGRFRVRRATGPRRSDRTTSSAMARRYRARPVGCPWPCPSPPPPPGGFSQRPSAGDSPAIRSPTHSRAQMGEVTWSGAGSSSGAVSSAGTSVPSSGTDSPASRPLVGPLARPRVARLGGPTGRRHTRLPAVHPDVDRQPQHRDHEDDQRHPLVHPQADDLVGGVDAQPLDEEAGERVAGDVDDERGARAAASALRSIQISTTHQQQVPQRLRRGTSDGTWRTARSPAAGARGEISRPQGSVVGRPNSSWFHQLPTRPMACASGSAGVTRVQARQQRDAHALGPPGADHDPEADAAPDPEAALPDVEASGSGRRGTAPSR